MIADIGFVCNPVCVSLFNDASYYQFEVDAGEKIMFPDHFIQSLWINHVF